MIKVTSNYKGHAIVVELDSSDELMKYWLTSWIDGFTLSRRAVFSYGGASMSDLAAQENDSIQRLLAKEAIVRYTFTDKYGNLHYWQRCSNIHQIAEPDFKAIWPMN